MGEVRRLSEEEAALVFRRAAELDAAAPGAAAAGPGFDREALERIGAEAGLSPHAVRRALDELRTGALERTAGAGAPAPGDVPRCAVIERQVLVSADEVTERLEVFLRGQAFRLCRRRGPGATVWEPNRSMEANLRRGIDFADRMRLSRVDGVELLVEAGAEGTFVRFDLDLTTLHRNTRVGRVAGVGLGVAGFVAAGAGLVLGAPEALLVVPGTAAGAAGSWFGSRSTSAKQVKRAVDAIELVVDELEHRRSLR